MKVQVSDIHLQLTKSYLFIFTAVVPAELLFAQQAYELVLLLPLLPDKWEAVAFHAMLKTEL